MRCPYCGSPVSLRGDRWECGFCGDSGFLNSSSRDAELDITFDLVFEIDLPETWQELKKAIADAGVKLTPELLHSMALGVIYEISRALALAGRPLPYEKQRALQGFLKNTWELGKMPSLGEILDAARRGRALFEKDGILTEERCGAFWKQLIQSLPQQNFPDLRELYWGFGNLYQYFISERCGDQAADRMAEIRDSFETHWYGNRYFHPKGTGAMERLSSDDDSRFDEDFRDLLAERFPEAFREYSLEDMEFFSLEEFLEDLQDADPRLHERIRDDLNALRKTGRISGKRIWNRLLDL